MFRFMLVIIILGVVGGSLFIAYAQPEKVPGPLQKYAPLIKQVVETGVSGTQTALSKSKEVQPAVMGAKTESSQIFQEDTAGKPLHQQAMEFTQYQYCKMVVNSYESASSVPSPTATPEKK